MHRLIILILLVCSSIVQAKIEKNYGAPLGYIPNDQLNTSLVAKTSKVKMSKASAKSSTTSSNANCTSSELAALSGDAFVNYLVDNEASCLSFLFENNDADTVFSQANLINVANSARDAAASYTGSTDFSNYFLYMRAAFYVEFYSPNLVSISDTSRQAINEALDAFEDVPNFATIATEQHGHLVTEWVNAADGAGEWTRYFDAVKALLDDVTAYKTRDYYNSIAYNSIMFYLFRGQNNDRYNFGENVIGNDTEIAGLLANFIVDTNVLNNIEYIADNATLELARLLQWPNIETSTIAAVQQALDANERLSSRWMALVTAIDSYDYIDCSDFTGDVCASDGLRDEILAIAFPNELEFDGGAMMFHTSLSKEEIEQVYYKLKEVEANFFKVTGATEPVAGDTNDVAIFRIYGNLQQYEQFQPFLYDLPSGNGGIYIERDATLYTWDREPWENTFSLEELARHEYVHYLVSRYLIPGFWGETEMYEDNRVTWLDEGLANFLAGGSQSEGITPLKTMVDWVADRDTHYTPAQASTVGYGDQLMYPYSALLFNYMFENKSEAFRDLTTALRNDDVVAYDNIRAQIGAQDANGFSNYINGWVSNSDSIEAPWKDYLTEAQIEFSYSSEVGDVLENDFGLADVICNDMSTTQYGCEVTLNYTVQNNDTPLFELHEEIDSLTGALMESSANNLNTANCYPIVVGTSSHTIRCEGGLRRVETEFIPDNSAPTTENLSLSVTEGNSVDGQMSANDVDSDNLTYSPTNPSNGTLSYDENTGQFTYTPNSSFTGTDTFTFTVSDGSVDSNESTVTITVNASSNGADNTNQKNSSSSGGSLGMFWLLLLSLLIVKNHSWQAKTSLLMLKVNRG